VGGNSRAGRGLDEALSQVAAGGYATQRQELLLTMQRSARSSIESESVAGAGARSLFGLYMIFLHFKAFG